MAAKKRVFGGEFAEWQVNDADLKSVASLPPGEVIRQAANGDVTSLDYLWRNIMRNPVWKKSKSVCSRMAHRAGECADLGCNEAFPTAVDVGAVKLLGVEYPSSSAALEERDPEDPERKISIRNESRSFVKRNVDQRDADFVKSKTSGSALHRLANLEELSTDDLEKEMRKSLGGGFMTDSRRKWNESRGLRQRIDQDGYFKGVVAVTGPYQGLNLVDAFALEWSATLNLRNSGTVNNVDALVIRCAENFAFIKPGGMTLMSVMAMAYDDACENTYVGVFRDSERLARAMRRKFPNADSDLLEPGSVEIFFTAVEECLTETYRKMETKPRVLLEIFRARQFTRNIPVPLSNEDLDKSAHDRKSGGRRVGGKR